jgi:hypothetical protein
MSIRNLGQRLDRLEQHITPAGGEVTVICVRYVPHGTLKRFKNDNGFYCERLPGQSEAQCYSRAKELVIQHTPSTPGSDCAILLLPDCEQPTQQDWDEQAPAVAAYRRESRS